MARKLERTGHEAKKKPRLSKKEKRKREQLKKKERLRAFASEIFFSGAF